MEYVFALLASLLLASCAGVPQTKALLHDPGQLPRAHEILNLPFIEQSQNYCGPASLAMMVGFSGKSVSAEELGPMMFTPGKKGTLPSDFIGAARRIGMLAVPVIQLRSVLIEVAADHPVAVLQNLGSSANPLWHYAVVSGFDLSKEEIILHSGKDRNLRMDFAQFERTWQGADYWALLAVSPQTLPVTATLSEMLLAANSLERVKMNHEANVAYRTILEKWPDQLVALFGLGNTAAEMNRWKEAARAFERAAELKPESAAIWHNLAEVYEKLHRSKHAARARQNAHRLNQSTARPN